DVAAARDSLDEACEISDAVAPARGAGTLVECDDRDGQRPSGPSCPCDLASELELVATPIGDSGCWIDECACLDVREAARVREGCLSLVDERSQRSSLLGPKRVVRGGEHGNRAGQLAAVERRDERRAKGSRLLVVEGRVGPVDRGSAERPSAGRLERA